MCPLISLDLCFTVLWITKIVIMFLLYSNCNILLLYCKHVRTLIINVQNKLRPVMQQFAVTIQ